MFVRRTTRQTYRYDLVENQFHIYTVTNKKIPVYGIKYVPYKQDNFRIMIPYYVCDVKYPIPSASRLLDRGYGLDFTPRHCTITHGQPQAHPIRHAGLSYLRAEKIDIPTGFDIYPMTTDNGSSIAVIQPTEKATQQQEQIAPLTHTGQGLRQILGGNTDYWRLDGDYATRVHKRPRKALFTPHNSGCPIPEGELNNWRLTIINRQGQEQEQLQENPTQLSKQELQRRLQFTTGLQKPDSEERSYLHAEQHQRPHQQGRAHNHNG